MTKTRPSGVAVRASYERTEGKNWRAVLRDSAGQVIWRCGHAHRNRDHNRIRMGTVSEYSASRCAEHELEELDARQEQLAEREMVQAMMPVVNEDGGR